MMPVSDMSFDGHQSSRTAVLHHGRGENELVFAMKLAHVTDGPLRVVVREILAVGLLLVMLVRETNKRAASANYSSPHRTTMDLAILAFNPVAIPFPSSSPTSSDSGYPIVALLYFSTQPPATDCNCSCTLTSAHSPALSPALP